MTGRFKLFSALFAFTFLVMAASSARTQEERRRPIEPVLTLPCCKCLGGTSTLDLSTISANPWSVNGSPAVFLSAIHPLWDINPGPAQWVSTVASGGTGYVAPGLYVYKLQFVVPKCAIEQRVSITGNYGGDDDVSISLDSNPPSQCSGGYCFNAAHHSLPTFGPWLVTPGTHTLIVNVQNSGGPSGMFVNAKLTTTCRN